MMKNLVTRVGMLLMAAALSVSFSACGSDEAEPDWTPIPNPMMTKITPKIEGKAEIGTETITIQENGVILSGQTNLYNINLAEGVNEVVFKNLRLNINNEKFIDLGLSTTIKLEKDNYLGLDNKAQLLGGPVYLSYYAYGNGTLTVQTTEFSEEVLKQIFRCAEGCYMSIKEESLTPSTYRQLKFSVVKK